MEMIQLGDGKMYFRKEVLVPFDKPPHMRDEDIPQPLRETPDIRRPQDPIYIQPHAGGLGDQLLYSTLPEGFYRQFGSREIYILAPQLKPEYPFFRNQEVPDLVWGRNPFVKEILYVTPKEAAELLNTTSMGNANDTYHRKVIRRYYKNNIRAAEALNGLAPVSDFPRVYVTPTFRQQFADKIYADPRSFSTIIPSTVFNQFIDFCAEFYGFNAKEVIILSSKYSGPGGTMVGLGNPTYEMTSLQEYVDLIYSCRMYLPIQSGNSALASAIKGGNPYPHVVALISTANENAKHWQWSNLDYCPTATATKSDFARDI
jgi:hypothetical protein